VKQCRDVPLPVVESLELGIDQDRHIEAECLDAAGDQAVGKASEALQGRKAEQQIGRAETMTEGPND
jgi:hypothetical protein